MKFKLRFPVRDISQWADKYEYSDDAPIAIAPAIRERGYLTKPEFLTLTRWKTQRTQKRCAANSADFIRSVTETALSTKDERFKIEALTLLSGVSWPTASVILHFCARDKYPILDFRALWSLSCAVPEGGYDFDLWWAYCEFTRGLSTERKVSMRQLDKALWQYSKTRQKIA